MSFCFLAGWPFAGKTYVLQKALFLLPENNIQIISPKKYIAELCPPEEYEKKSEEERKEINIAAWECALDVLQEAIDKNGTFVYDTACASYGVMWQYFKAAREKHQVVYVYVKADLETCKKRAGNKWMSESVVKRYQVNFKESVPKLIKLAHKVIIIQNNDGEPDVSKLIEVLRR